MCVTEIKLDSATAGQCSVRFYLVSALITCTWPCWICIYKMHNWQLDSKLYKFEMCEITVIWGVSEVWDQPPVIIIDFVLLLLLLQVSTVDETPH